jgi:peptidoglycan hydrolase-like protein with peptidoglycan-binding domain
MRLARSISGGLPLVLLTACVAAQTQVPAVEQRGASTPGFEHPAPDRLLSRGDLQIAEQHLQAFGFDPGPIDGIFTAETAAAVRAFQARYGLTVSGLLDYATREELKLGIDPKRGG